jgi:hypothetical protein
MFSAGFRKCLPESSFGEHRQSPVERRIRRAGHAGLVEHAQRTLHAGRFDDPRAHQLAEHFVPAGGLVEAEHVVCATQGVPQMRCPRRGNRQRLRPRSSGDTQIQLGLAGGQPLGGGSFHGGQRGLIVSRTEVLDRA